MRRLSPRGLRSRSRTSDRGPTLILPAFHELKEGALPAVVVTRYEGDDMVSLGEYDASWTANATAFLGTPFPQLIYVAAIAAAAAARDVTQEMAEILPPEEIVY